MSGKKARPLQTPRNMGVSFTMAPGLCKIRQGLKQSTTGSTMARSESKVVHGIVEKFLFVITVILNENTYRIISVHKTTRHEQERYFKGCSLFS
jgi:uncharacterized DUF497 family protein